MRIDLLFFAHSAGWMGKQRLTLDTSAASLTLKELLEDPRLRPIKSRAASLRFAINEDFARADHALSDGDEVAILPPVSGG
ncbi:MAG: MoaD/ThiS family protein [Elusimicrobiota bacterium]